MTSIGSYPNAPTAPNAALTTPACEHDESTLTPRPRTRAARKRSARIKGSGTACPSRTVWCPTNPASYDVTRSISPLTKKKPASTCALACFLTRPPAVSIASNVGSGFNSTSVPAGVMVPRWSGRSGCKSTIGGGSPSSRRDRPQRRAPGGAACQCDRHTADGREPDAPTRILQPDLCGGPDVEEDRALFGAAPPRDQRREAVAGKAQMPPGLDAVMAVLGRKMGSTRDQSPELGKLRHTFIHAG